MAPSYYHVSITVWKDETQRVGIALVDHIYPYLFLESLMTFIGRQSKHRKGQLEHPASDEKVFLTKNEHFLKLCPGGQLGLPVSDTEYLKKYKFS